MSSRALRVVPDVPRFAIAVRVSRVMGRSGERFLSPEIQTKGARAAVAHIGGVVDESVGDAGVFYDLDVSGAVAPSDRPGLGEALELVRAGRLQGVALYDLSRWSRETTSGLRELEEVAKAGGQVLSASEAIDLNTPTGVFSTTVQLAAHQLRRQQASEAWKATHQRRFEMGLPHGKLPFGYVNRDGGAVADPVLGPAVTIAFQQYAAGMVSQKQLAERLGTLRGRSMRQGVVSQLLRNRFYVGELELMGETRPGRHTPLVDDGTFAAVARRLRDDQGAGPHSRTPGSPLIGLVFCAVCDGPVYRRGQGQRSGLERLPALICSGKAAGTCVGIGAPRVKDVELAVRDLALLVAADLRDEGPAMMARSTKAARSQVEVERLKVDEKELLNDIGRLGVSHARRVMDEQAYGPAVAILQAELAAVRERLHLVEGAVVAASRPLQELESAAERLRLFWPVLEPLEARAYLRCFVPRVKIRRAGYRGEAVAARIWPDDGEK